MLRVVSIRASAMSGPLDLEFLADVFCFAVIGLLPLLDAPNMNRFPFGSRRTGEDLAPDA